LNIDKGDKYEEVEVDTLDNIVSGLGVKKVNYIKMDIEGAEIEAFQGMEGILKDKEVKLAIAAYHDFTGEPTYKTLVTRLETEEFQVVNTGDGMLYAKKTHSH
jgi:hypothetical protein